MRFSIILSLFVSFFLCSTGAKAIDVSADGPQLIHLSQDASSVIVGNPAHATVALDNPRLLIITAGAPGVTKLTVIGKDGQIILDDHIVVNSPSGNLIRVKNACINGGDVCQQTKMYHCKNGQACNDVSVSEPSYGQGGGGSSTTDGAGQSTNGEGLEE